MLLHLYFQLLLIQNLNNTKKEVDDIDLEDSTLEIMQNCLNVYIIETI